jgi:hypothetical protein
LKKIQSFYVLKIESSRLKDAKYNIKNLSIDQARINSEIISLANSQLIRTIFQLTKRSFSQEKLDGLLARKARLSKKKNDESVQQQLLHVYELIDKELFISELVSIHVENKKHYEYILRNNGFMLNGVRFVPLLASSAQIRRNTALFIDESLKEEITRIFNNGRDETKELVPAKYSAYVSLFSSSSLPVSTPSFAVVPDCVFTAKHRVNFAEWVGEGIDPIVKETEKELEFNGFDGQSLISPEMSEVWANELGLGYIPSSYIIRAPYTKGQLITFSIHEFAEKIAKKKTFMDIYGVERNIDDYDVLISASMFKLWDSYKSTEEFVSHCEKNNLGWGITKAAPKTDREWCRSSYQFLQILNLQSQDIVEVCKPTVNWLRSVSGGDLDSTLLYLLGEMDLSKNGWFDKLEPIIQGLLLENELLKDSYLIDHLSKSLGKKRNDSKMGRLLFRGSYQNLMADPYAQAAHIMGLGLKPLLENKQHYSRYWNERGVKQVTGIKSPIVHHSENNTLHLQNREDVNYWYQHITSGTIFPTNGIGLDFAICAGSDGDGDQLVALDHPSFIKCKIDDLPIFYDTQKAKKVVLDKANEIEIYKSHLLGMNQKVGYFTNVSTTFYSLLNNFEKGSKEYEAIQQRLRWSRALQGLELDRIKGLTVPPFPQHWTKWKRITDEMTSEEREQREFYNRILADKRPLFQIWLYGAYRKKYKKELAIYDNISKTKWGISFNELINTSEKIEEQQRLADRYVRKSGFIDNNSPMNALSKYMELELEKIKVNLRENSNSFDYSVLLSKDHKEPRKYDIEKVVLLYKEYKSLRRSFRENHNEFDGFSSSEQISEYIRRRAASTISSNSSDLADLAVLVCYGGVLGKNSKGFCWSVFGNYIIQNIKDRKRVKSVRVPLPKPDGKIEYLFSKYSFYNLNIEVQ